MLNQQIESFSDSVSCFVKTNTFRRGGKVNSERGHCIALSSDHPYSGLAKSTLNKKG